MTTRTRAILTLCLWLAAIICGLASSVSLADGRPGAAILECLACMALAISGCFTDPR